jgi:hypothetical protein
LSTFVDYDESAEMSGRLSSSRWISEAQRRASSQARLIRFKLGTPLYVDDVTKGKGSDRLSLGGESSGEEEVENIRRIKLCRLLNNFLVQYRAGANPQRDGFLFL